MSPTEPAQSLFATLEMAPTLDPAELKRAWFRAVKLHPPQQDADAFARIRAAYEALSAPGALHAAYLAEPLDLEREIRARRERLDPLTAELREAMAKRREAALLRARFEAIVTRAGWPEVVRRLGR